MHFDDRLATVLRHRATGERAARTQYRQLLDLLGDPAGGRDDSLEAAAYLRLDALGALIPFRERARIVESDGIRIRNPRLVEWLAEAEPDVAAAALSQARLSEAEWAQTIPELPIRCMPMGLRFPLVHLRQQIPWPPTFLSLRASPRLCSV